MKMKRLAVLEADDPIPPVAQARGSYGDIFKELIQNQDEGKTIEITAFNIVEKGKEAYPDLNEIDGILITGSKHNAYSDSEWVKTLCNFVVEAYDADVRIIGVCFGHQIVARAFNGKVIVNPKGWEVGITKTSLSGVGRKIFSEIEGSDLYIEQMHKDIVCGDILSHNGQILPVSILASTKICANQGMYLPSKILTLQGHPEFNAFIVYKLVESRMKSGVFTNEFGIKTLEYQNEVTRNDGPIVTKALIRFLD